MMDQVTMVLETTGGNGLLDKSGGNMNQVAIVHYTDSHGKHHSARYILPMYLRNKPEHEVREHLKHVVRTWHTGNNYTHSDMDGKVQLKGDGSIAHGSTYRSKRKARKQYSSAGGDVYEVSDAGKNKLLVQQMGAPGHVISQRTMTQKSFNEFRRIKHLEQV